ncbi:hypothetical protein MATR_14120 [Marivirga tractuosa]|uniref:hypothetical protein n=1 Tax=Marivirga tractuosa TaxID=1006 RepID=UPI002B2E3077|nr:hypothetical protein MATR_14120 [Marivirga tractuosa]
MENNEQLIALLDKYRLQNIFKSISLIKAINNDNSELLDKTVMNRLHLILLSFILISCQESQEEDTQKLNKEVNKVVNVFIEDKAMYKYGVILNKLSPYEYYNLQHTSGKEIPPSRASYDLKNEISLLKIIDSEKYFDSIKNKNNLKTQIIQSEKIYSDFSLNLNYLREKNYAFKDTLTSYRIYPPLFNNDSTAAYIQYDFFDYGWKEGSGTIYIKKKRRMAFF